MSVESVLVKKSTKEILKYDPYPRLEVTPFLEGEIDPDLEWLVVHIPHPEPDYDPRIYILVTNLPDLNFLESFQEHPNYIGIKSYQITYTPEKRSKEDIIISIENAERQYNSLIWSEGEHKDKQVLMMQASLKAATGSILNSYEELLLEEMNEIVVKLNKNKANKDLLISQVDLNQVPNIDLGWESV